MTNTALEPIGILGGTFDPIHHGHLRLAVELCERLNLAEVRFIPAARPPHREIPTATEQLRFAMIQAAIMGISELKVDGRELLRDGVSYTVDTLISLREEFPQRSLCLILGMDAFMGLPNWYQWERLITLAHLLIVRRFGTLLPETDRMQDFLRTYHASDPKVLHQQPAGTIWVEEIPTIAISATQIRGLIADGRNPRYLLPLAVLDIINAHQLYRANEENL
jgi:nicotinate-nucleotide adenylyltransferase